MKPKRIRNNQLVSIFYRVTADDGRVVDQVLTDEPLVYRHGTGELPAIVEIRLTGLSPGDTVHFVLDAAECFGERTGTKSVWLSRQDLPPDVPPKKGVSVVGIHDGRPTHFWIRDMDEDRILLDANDPLAGWRLHFTIWVVEIDPADTHGHN